ncbi:hypothetical protein NE236_34310 [Actinoallomurus purpureus]|uniref:hypothetical protein n=1 Tax=Actinoallomurus purpureus TaxID=478114 RepID=UPI0020924F6E|nr:hypothetical protein [Actinoallomurus purpureus]MCO6010055.1 hypothetical protein [Actinoallomurus purpureus]
MFSDPLRYLEENDSWPRRAIEGVIADASPHVLVLTLADGSQVRLPMSASVSIWYDGRAELAALRPGRHVVVRPAGAGGLAAERVWVDIARVTGVITKRVGEVFEVDAGPHRGHLTVTVPEHALRRVQVRHPRLEPGALLDVIGVRRDHKVIGLRPARTSPQPSPHAVAPPSRRSGTSARVLRGTATWYDDPDGVRGAAYPALDPHGAGGGCGAGPAARLPYLSLGSELRVRNECTGLEAHVPVIECGCLAARFCDRCVRCGTSPRGRVIELSRSAFVDLGGDLDAGCFNVTVRVDRP